MPDLIRHPETERLQTALDSRLRGNDKIEKFAVLSIATQFRRRQPKKHNIIFWFLLYHTHFQFGLRI